MNQNKSFFEKLFDFSFSSFIAPQIVGVLYILGLIAMVLTALGIISEAFDYGFIPGLGTLVFSLLGLLIFAIFLRIALESFVAVIRTAESTRILAENVMNSGNASQPPI